MASQVARARAREGTLLEHYDRHPFRLAGLVLVAAALCKVGGILVEGAAGMVVVLLVDVVALSTGVALVLGDSLRRAGSALVVSGAIALTLGNLFVAMGALWWAYR